MTWNWPSQLEHSQSAHKASDLEVKGRSSKSLLCRGPGINRSRDPHHEQQRSLSSEEIKQAERAQHKPTYASELSTFANVSPGLLAVGPSNARQLSRDCSEDPLGLVAIRTLEVQTRVDFIFLHSLGGTRLMTWARNRQLDSFSLVR